MHLSNFTLIGATCRPCGAKTENTGCSIGKQSIALTYIQNRQRLAYLSIQLRAAATAV